MDKSDGPIQSVARAITIMEALLREPELGVSELSEELDLGKSTVFRLLQTMKAHGIIDQARSGKYRLGVRLSLFGDAAVSRIDLRQEAAPFLSELAKFSGESVNLAILDEFNILYIDRIDSHEPLRMGVKIGQRLPAFCVSMGKAILANLPEDELETIFENPKFQETLVRRTDTTVTELGALRKQLQTIKEQGFAVDEEEYNRGVRCIGAPIFNHLGKVVAALSTTGPTVRMSYNKIHELVPHVKATAMNISKKIGFRGKRDG
jgi:DNA-binding IclR family transcriptional regulator